MLAVFVGCGLLPTVEDQPAIEERRGPLPNPIVVRAQDREFFWNTLVDTVDDYFEIATEQRVQFLGNMPTEGHILTKNKLGSNIAEIWQKDSTPGFERWQSTFQPIRRRAELRITPDNLGYAVQVTVFKELEDTDRPEEAAVGKNLRRHDGSLVKQVGPNRSRPVQLGWIPKGRDTSLEQTILADISARFDNVQIPADIQLLPPIHDPLDVVP